MTAYSKRNFSEDTNERDANKATIERARRAKRRKLQRRRRNMQIAIRLGMSAIIAGALLFTLNRVSYMLASTKTAEAAGIAGQTVTLGKVVQTPPDYDVQLLTVNKYSRPGTPIDPITGIVVHYTANPGTSARQNRNYFEGLKDSHDTSASSHFVIGIEGELIQCIPCNEIAYASNDRNHDTIAIECCIPDETGKFADDTYDTLIHLLAWLCGRYDLTTDAIIRHYDVTGKACPKYYVENETAWEQLKADVNRYIERYGVVQAN